MSKVLLEQLNNMIEELSVMYEGLGVIRDNLTNETKEGTNKARELIEKLQQTLHYQADLIIYEDRNDILNLNKTNIKIKEIFKGDNDYD